MSRIHGLLVAIGMFVSVATPSWSADLEEMLNLVPGDANLVSILRVGDLYASPRAKQEKWQRDGYGSLASTVPCRRSSTGGRPSGAQDAGSPTRTWASTIFSQTRPIAISELAQRENSAVDSVAGAPVVLTRRNEYYVQLPDNLLALLSPADRQDAARWVRTAHEEPRLKLSPYLEEALARSDDTYLLVYELEHLFIPESVRNYLLASPTFLGKPKEAEGMAAWIGKIRGVALSISIKESIGATLRIDLHERPPIEQGQLLARVVDEYLDEIGAHITELESAQVGVEERSVWMKAELSASTLRHILSLANSSLPTFAVPATIETSASSPDAQRSIAFYRALMQALNDLEERSRKSKSYLKTAYWVETYAKRIEQLPIVGVDQELVEYAHLAITNLRAIAASLRGVPIQVNTLEKSVVYNVNYLPWSRAVTLDMWGNYIFVPRATYVTSNLAEVRRKQAAIVAEGQTQREQVWQMIEDERYSLRRGLAERLKVDPDAPVSVLRKSP